MVSSQINLPELASYYGDLSLAERELQAFLEVDSRNIDAWLNLGNVYLGQGNYGEAIASYLHLLTIDPNLSDVYHNLGLAYQAKGDSALGAFYLGEIAYLQADYATAIDYYYQYTQSYWSDPSCYCKLAECHDYVKNYQQVMQTYWEGIKANPDSDSLYINLIWNLQKYGYISEARLFAYQGAKKFPKSGRLKTVAALLLPIAYESVEEIDFYRELIIQGLEDLIRVVDDAEKNRTLDGNILFDMTRWATNFFLHYQNKNDLEVQKKYGYLLRQIIAINFPEWSQISESNQVQYKPEQGEKIKVGYILGSDISSLIWGWLRYSDRSQFEIYCYHLGELGDSLRKFPMYADYIQQLPEDIPSICRKITGDRLHILVFTEIGLSIKITQLASLKLAPIQCTTWLHPVTSGLPTIDYFLSSQLIEPEDALDHYSEQLIRLPQLGIILEKFQVSELTKERHNFHLSENDVVYLCCQSIQKYLPQHDYLLAQICQAVPNAKLVFPDSHWSDNITKKFQQRLQRVFDKLDLDLYEYCLFIPRQGLEDYLSLMSVCDIFLDTIGWSGGLTTLDAVGCGLPVVTYPGELFRGRQSLGILQLLEVTETIANSEENYLEIAIRLGLDHEWRWQIIEKLQTNYAEFNPDTSCVQALEEFYRKAVNKQQLHQIMDLPN